MILTSDQGPDFSRSPARELQWEKTAGSPLHQQLPETRKRIKWSEMRFTEWSISSLSMQSQNVFLVETKKKKVLLNKLFTLISEFIIQLNNNDSLLISPWKQLYPCFQGKIFSWQFLLSEGSYFKTLLQLEKFTNWLCCDCWWCSRKGDECTNIVHSRVKSRSVSVMAVGRVHHGGCVYEVYLA